MQQPVDWEKRAEEHRRLIEELTEEQRNELKEAFSLFDRDGDGTITLPELKVVMKSMGQNPTEEELKEMMLEVDQNSNMEVDFEEFLILMAKKLKEGEMDEELIEAFKTFDKNNNGYITESELKAVMHAYGEKLSDEEIHLMFKEADNDKDNKINFNDFVLMMMAK